MKSATTRHFWKCFDALPRDVQELAIKSFRLWRENPNHPSLHFKPVHPIMPIYSARIGIGFRAVGVRKDDGTLLWYWIGTHAAYERLIRG